MIKVDSGVRVKARVQEILFNRGPDDEAVPNFSLWSLVVRSTAFKKSSGFRLTLNSFSQPYSNQYDWNPFFF